MAAGSNDCAFALVWTTLETLGHLRFHQALSMSRGLLMRTQANRARHARCGLRYPGDPADAAWAVSEPVDRGGSASPGTMAVSISGSLGCLVPPPHTHGRRRSTPRHGQAGVNLARACRHQAAP